MDDGEALSANQPSRSLIITRVPRGNLQQHQPRCHRGSAVPPPCPFSLRWLSIRPATLRHLSLHLTNPQLLSLLVAQSRQSRQRLPLLRHKNRVFIVFSRRTSGLEWLTVLEQSTAMMRPIALFIRPQLGTILVGSFLTDYIAMSSRSETSTGLVTIC
jgi:hypothetical protein